MPNKPQKLTLPLLITRGAIIFPGTQSVIDAGRDFSMGAIDAGKNQTDSLIFVTSQMNEDVDVPAEGDLFKVGTLCHIITVSPRDGYYKLRIEGVERVELNSIKFDETGKIFIAEGTVLPLPEIDEERNDEIIRLIKREIDEYPDLIVKMPKTISNLIAKTRSAQIVCYAIASFTDAPIRTKQALLETNNYDELVEYAKILLKGEQPKTEIDRGIQDSVRESA